MKVFRAPRSGKASRRKKAVLAAVSAAVVLVPAASASAEGRDCWHHTSHWMSERYGHEGREHHRHHRKLHEATHSATTSTSTPTSTPVTTPVTEPDETTSTSTTSTTIPVVVTTSTTSTTAPKPTTTTTAPKPTTTTTAPKPSGTFTGPAAESHGYSFTVQITVSNGVITGVKAVGYETSGVSGSINSGAIPKLQSEALSAKSAKIASVSGATQTSDAFKTSLQGAITKAKL